MDDHSLFVSRSCSPIHDERLISRYKDDENSETPSSDHRPSAKLLSAYMSLSDISSSEEDEKQVCFSNPSPLNTKFGPEATRVINIEPLSN